MNVRQANSQLKQRGKAALERAEVIASRNISCAACSGPRIMEGQRNSILVGQNGARDETGVGHLNALWPVLLQELALPWSCLPATWSPLWGTVHYPTLPRESSGKAGQRGL